MTTIGRCLQITKELEDLLSKVDENLVEKLISDILTAKRIFVAGVGRSRLIIKAFAMRLMHLGLTVYVVGEVVTPAIKSGDLLIIGSNSGETRSLVGIGLKAKELSVKTALVTGDEASALAKLADRVLVLPRTTKNSQPGGNAFEQGMLLLLDCMVIDMARRQNRQLTFELHANLQ